MALQKINWTQVDTENVPSGSIINLGSPSGSLHNGYFDNLFVSGTSLADYIAQNSGSGGSGGSAGTSGTSGVDGSSGTSGTSGVGGYLQITQLLNNASAITIRSGVDIVTEWTTNYTSISGSTLLFNLSFTASADTTGLKQFDLLIDGNVVASSNFYFIATNLHLTIPCTFNVENLLPGNHVIEIRIPLGVSVDGGDYAHLTVIETMSSGINGTSGTSGTSGIDGTSGSSGTSGVNGSSGTSGTSGLDGSNGSSGTSGTSGTNGSSGSSGTSGSSGSSGNDGNLAIWNYKVTTGDTTNDPGPGNFTINVSDWGLTVTEIAFDNFSFSPSINLSTYLDTLSVGTILKLVKIGDPTIFKYLQITGVSPLISGFENYSVNQLSSNGSPNDGDSFMLTPLGLAGTSGTSGSSGTLTLSGDTDNGIITLNGSAPYATVESNMTFDGNNLNITGSANISDSVTASFFTGSFVGDGSNLFNIPASGVTGLQLDRIVDNSVSASISEVNGLTVNTKTSISGSLKLSGDFTLTGSVVYSTGSDIRTKQGIESKIVSGSDVIIDLGDYHSANFDYLIMSGLNMRAGNIAAVWSGSDSSYNEINTTDLGNTSPVTFGISNDGKLSANVSSGSWKVQINFRALGSTI